MFTKSAAFPRGVFVLRYCEVRVVVEHAPHKHAQHTSPCLPTSYNVTIIMRFFFKAGTLTYINRTAASATMS